MIRIAQLLQGKSGAVCGWVKSVREYKRHSFVVIDDGGPDALQMVVDGALPAGLITGASVQAEGTLAETPKGGKEMHTSSLTVLGGSDATYPFAKKAHSMEHLRQYPHLRPRTATIAAAMRVRSEASFALHNFFRSQGFYYIHTPIITGNDCEGAGELFTLSPDEFFDRPAYLTVSGQLQAEAFACAMSRVYTFGPTFRAELSHTQRHLAEFWMLEPEMIGYNLEQTCNLAEEMLRAVARDVAVSCRKDLEFFETTETVDSLADGPAFARVKFADVADPGETDLPTEKEKAIAQANGPTFVTNYPAATTPFYMKRAATGATTLNFDMLLPGVGEVIGGSVREERFDVLESEIQKRDIKGLDWYLELRKYGTVPHAGFGLGFERLVAYITGLSNVRDVIPVPRVHRSLPL